MKGIMSLAQAYFYVGVGLLLGGIYGYYIFTSGWSILICMIGYISLGVLILYLKKRRS